MICEHAMLVLCVMGLMLLSFHYGCRAGRRWLLEELEQFIESDT